MKVFFTVFLLLLFFAGLGFCIYKIIKSIRNEYKLKNVFLNPSFDFKVEGEVFFGSSYLAALTVYITKNPLAAEKILNSVFKSSFKSDWGTFCRSAQNLQSSLNGDLLCECLASKLKKINADEELIKKTFEVLKDAEVFWNKNERGSEPSIYLSELLNYSLERDELSRAYRTLGLKEDAGFEKVKSAHRKLIAKFHPDTKKTSWSKKEKEAFMRIQEAYELIAQSFM